MRRKAEWKEMQITYQNEWEYTNIHVDLPIPYEEDYQMPMLRANKNSGHSGSKRLRNRWREPVYI